MLLTSGIFYVLEYKVGADAYYPHALDQTLDYALGVKNFH